MGKKKITAVWERNMSCPQYWRVSVFVIWSDMESFIFSSFTIITYFIC